MRHKSKRIPSALKHGIYSGLGLLPTESPASFRRFKKQVFAELNPVGRLEKGIVEQIVVFEWRRENLSTYDLAQRADFAYLDLLQMRASRTMGSRATDAIASRKPQPRSNRSRAQARG